MPSPRKEDHYDFQKGDHDTRFLHSNENGTQFNFNKHELGRGDEYLHVQSHYVNVEW